MTWADQLCFGCTLRSTERSRMLDSLWSEGHGYNSGSNSHSQSLRGQLGLSDPASVCINRYHVSMLCIPAYRPVCAQYACYVLYTCMSCTCYVHYACMFCIYICRLWMYGHVMHIYLCCAYYICQVCIYVHICMLCIPWIHGHVMHACYAHYVWYIYRLCLNVMQTCYACKLCKFRGCS